jgi:hypothetical protein
MVVNSTLGYTNGKNEMINESRSITNTHHDVEIKVPGALVSFELAKQLLQCNRTVLRVVLLRFSA